MLLWLLLFCQGGLGSALSSSPLPPPPTTPSGIPMEPATLSCPNSPILSLHLPATKDANEKKVPHFLVRYVPLVDGLMTFTSHNLFRCLMDINDRLPARIDPAAVFHYHIFTFIHHVKTWNCPGNWGDVAYFLEKNQESFRDLGISRVYFVVLATERQFLSFHRLNNLSAHSDFVRLLRHQHRVPLTLPNPFQTSGLGRLDADALPLCHLTFPSRQEAEGNLSVFEERPLFSGDAVVTLKGLSVALAALTLSLVLCVSCCLWACWMGERRQRRMTVYKGLNCPTKDYDRSYIDLTADPHIPPSLLEPLQEELPPQVK